MTDDGDALQRQADLDAVAALSRQYRASLLRYFSRRGLDGVDAEDGVQEVFARLCRREGLNAVERQDGYLFQVAAHVAADHHRRGAVRSLETRPGPDESAAADLPDERSPERVHAGREELELLTAALRSLPERTRSVFLLARMERMRQAEIARRLGISVSTVEKHLVKAYARLSERMGRLP